MTWDAPAESAERARLETRWTAARRLVRRSILFVPANVPRFIEGAYRRDADAVMLDLEDSVPLSEKSAARAALASAIDKVGRGGADVLVRVNKPYALAHEDVVAAVRPGVVCIAFPKVESAREVAIVDAWIGAAEERSGLSTGTVQLAVAIESAHGIGRIDEILAASDRIVTVDLGAEDFTRDLEIEPTQSGTELSTARHLVVLAARRAGVQALGLATTLANYGDLAALRSSIVVARDMGFRGAQCIHPAQVPALNELFSPPAERVARARRVLDLYAAAIAEGRASASLDGQMIDVPVAERARFLLERVEAIEHHERRKRAALEAGGA